VLLLFGALWHFLIFFGAIQILLLTYLLTYFLRAPYMGTRAPHMGLGWKSRPNFARFDPVKFREKVVEMSHVHVCYMLSSVRLSFVCRLSSVTFVRPTQAIEIFGNVFTPFGTEIVSGEPLCRGFKPKRGGQNIAILDLSKAISRTGCKNRR